MDADDDAYGETSSIGDVNKFLFLRPDHDLSSKELKPKFPKQHS